MAESRWKISPQESISSLDLSGEPGPPGESIPGPPGTTRNVTSRLSRQILVNGQVIRLVVDNEDGTRPEIIQRRNTADNGSEVLVDGTVVYSGLDAPVTTMHDVQIVGGQDVDGFAVFVEDEIVLQITRIYVPPTIASDSRDGNVYSIVLAIGDEDDRFYTTEEFTAYTFLAGPYRLVPISDGEMLYKLERELSDGFWEDVDVLFNARSLNPFRRGDAITNSFFGSYRLPVVSTRRNAADTATEVVSEGVVVRTVADTTAITASRHRDFRDDDILHR